MQESVLEDRFGIVQYTTFAPAVAVRLGSYLTWCDLGDFFFGYPAMSVVALSNAWSRLAKTQGNRADKLRNWPSCDVSVESLRY